MLLKVLQELKPDYLAVSFDVSGPTFRDQVYDKYKAQRVKADQDLYDQIPLVYQVVEAFGIPIYTKQGFEADDVIGTIVKKLSAVSRQLTAIIVTGDMDMLQLVDGGRVKVYELRKGLSDIVIFDAAKVKEKYGFGPERVVDYKALCGDASDNIPGVRGVGEKTAKELIEKIGGVEEIYKNIRNTKTTKLRNEFSASVVKKLEDGEKDAKMSKELATIRRDVPGLKFSVQGSAFNVQRLDYEKIKDLFAKFEFFSLRKRIPGASANPEAEISNQKSGIHAVRSRKLIMVTAENQGQFLGTIKNAKEFVCREVLSGREVSTAELLGLVFVLGGQGYYVSGKWEMGNGKWLTIFSDPKKTLVGHDLKQLIKVLRLRGVEVKNKLFDVMVASYVANSSTRAHDLKSLALRELNQELPVGSEQTSIFGVDPRVAAEELCLIEALYRRLAAALEKFGGRGLFTDIEMKLIPVLAEMELNGVAIDAKKLAGLSTEVAKEIRGVSAKIYDEAGETFNISSSVQLRDILFDRLKLPAADIKKGKTGYSTAVSELEKLRGAHPIIGMIEEYRELEKLRNTYIDVLPALVNKKTGRIHTSFNQTVAATGRLSSSDPNLQNIPVRTELGREVRAAFVAAPGYTLLAADYSQIELRIVASLAQDKKLMEIFAKGEDVHTATAAAINGVPLEKVTRAMRYGAKEVNFGVLYGMGAFGLSWRAGIPQAQAKEFIDKYFEQFAGVKKYIDQTIKFAREEGYVETLFGRRRYLPELKADNFQLRAAGERMAINMPVQGTAADLMKLAMIKVHENIKTLKHKNSDVKMILQVHDELVFEVKKGLEDEVGRMVKEAMEKVTELRVPIEVRVSVGERWGELKS